MMRNRKFLPHEESPSGAANGELPLYNHTNGNGNTHGHHLTPGSTTSRRRRRIPRSKNHSASSAVGLIFGCFTVASLGIVGWNHVYPHDHHRHIHHPFQGHHKIGGMHRFLARAEDSVPSNNGNNKSDNKKKLDDLVIDPAPTNVEYDIAILGAGPAGLSAAIYGARAGLQVVVLGSQVGLLSETPLLENFPGFYPYPSDSSGIAYNGENWLKTTRNQAHKLGAHFAMPGLLATSLDIQQNGNGVTRFSIPTQLDPFEAKSVIVATGATPRRLVLTHEEALWGKQLHNCAICDGPSYHGKNVVVVGGGDAAIDAAIYLSRQCHKVTLVHRRNSFDKAKALASLELVKRTPNIEIRTPYVVSQWNTKKSQDAIDEEDVILTGVTLSNVETKESQQIECDGAFLMIGATPNTDWLSNHLSLEDNGLIRLDQNHGSTAGMVSATSVEGIFAAGEVIDAKYKQAITAAAEGAQAALDAERWLRSQQNGSQTKMAAKIAAQQPRRVKEELPMQVKKEPKKERQLENDEDDCNLTEKDCITRLVNKYPVVVFSKPWCPYCRKALEALAIAGLSNPYVVDLSQYPNTFDIQSTLASMTGRRTVPNVFVGGESIGGGDETAAMQRAGKLKPLLIKVGAIDEPKEEDLPKATDLGPPPNGDYGCDLGTLECIQAIVKKYPLVLFSLSWCPECHRMLELLAMVGITDPHIIDLDDYKDNGTSFKIRQSLVELARSNQVPSLFVGGEALGRHHRVVQLHRKEKFLPKLRAAGLIK